MAQFANRAIILHVFGCSGFRVEGAEENLMAPW